MIKKGRLTDNEKELLGESCPVFDTTDIPFVIAKCIDEDYINISDCYMGIQYRKGGFKSKNVKVKSVVNDGIAFLSGDINIGSIYINHDLDFTYTNSNHADCIHFQSRDTDTWKPAPITNVNIAKVTLKVSGKGAEDKGHIMFSEPEINDNINMFSKGFEITTTAKNPKAPAINSNNFRNSTFGSPEFPLDPDKICNLPFRVIGNKPNSPESFGNTIHCYYGLKLELENPDGFNVIIHERSKEKHNMKEYNSKTMKVENGHLFIENRLNLTRDDMLYWSSRWKNFKPYELSSRDFSLRINIKALDSLQELRTDLGKPLHINSAYRNPAHNKSIGGKSNSDHTWIDGRSINASAFDVHIYSSSMGRELEKLAIKHGFNAVGRYRSSKFIHISQREPKPNGKIYQWGRW